MDLSWLPHYYWSIARPHILVARFIRKSYWSTISRVLCPSYDMLMVLLWIIWFPSSSANLYDAIATVAPFGFYRPLQYFYYLVYHLHKTDPIRRIDSRVHSTPPVVGDYNSLRIEHPPNHMDRATAPLPDLGHPVLRDHEEDPYLWCPLRSEVDLYCHALWGGCLFSWIHLLHPTKLVPVSTRRMYILCSTKPYLVCLPLEEADPVSFIYAPHAGPSLFVWRPLFIVHLEIE